MVTFFLMTITVILMYLKNGTQNPTFVTNAEKNILLHSSKHGHVAYQIVAYKASLPNNFK